MIECIEGLMLPPCLLFISALTAAHKSPAAFKSSSTFPAYSLKVLSAFLSQKHDCWMSRIIIFLTFVSFLTLFLVLSPSLSLNFLCYVFFSAHCLQISLVKKSWRLLPAVHQLKSPWVHALSSCVKFPLSLCQCKCSLAACTRFVPQPGLSRGPIRPKGPIVPFITITGMTPSSSTNLRDGK